MTMQDDNSDGGEEVITMDGDGAEDTGSQAEDRGDNLADTSSEGDDAPDGDDKPAPEPQQRDKPQPQHIPKARFDEVNSKKNELALELEEARRELEQMRQSGTKAPANDPPPEPPAPSFDESAKEREYAQALIDGDMDAAVQIRAEINRHIRNESRREFEADTNERATRASVQEVSARAVQDYPYLDTDDGAEALDLIVASRDARVARGIPMPEALRQAVAAIAPRFAPANTETPGDGLPTAAAPSDTRTRDALKRGAADSQSQPPHIQDGSGNRALAARVNPIDLTEEQFEGLTMAEKKRLRGD